MVLNEHTLAPAPLARCSIDARRGRRAHQPAEKQETSEEKMAKSVGILARQTVAGLGGTAMKTCLAYIKNALTKPEVRTGLFVALVVIPTSMYCCLVEYHLQ